MSEYAERTIKLAKGEEIFSSRKWTLIDLALRYPSMSAHVRNVSVRLTRFNSFYINNIAFNVSQVDLI